MHEFWMFSLLMLQPCLTFRFPTNILKYLMYMYLKNINEMLCILLSKSLCPLNDLKAFYTHNLFRHCCPYSMKWVLVDLCIILSLSSCIFLFRTFWDPCTSASLGCISKVNLMIRTAVAPPSTRALWCYFASAMLGRLINGALFWKTLQKVSGKI